MKDKYWAASERALRATSFELSRAQNDLNSAVACGDKDSASVAVMEIADLARRQENIVRLQQQYSASKQPPPMPSAEERAARPWQKMDWTDIVQMTRGSKYAKDIAPNDPNLVAGYAEAMRRRSRGE
jgi:hypothetical protein